MFQITIQSSTVGAESFRSSYNFQADSNRLYSKMIINITFNSPPVQLQFLISWTNYYLSIPNISRFRTHFKFYSSTIHYLPVCDIALIVWLPIYFHRLDIDIFTTYSRGQYCERFSIIQMHLYLGEQRRTNLIFTTLSVAGPRVHTIFVFLINKNPPFGQKGYTL